MWGISIYVLAIVVVTLADDEGGTNNPVTIQLKKLERTKLVKKYTQLDEQDVTITGSEDHSRTTEKLKLSYNINNIYVGVMAAGTPPQEFTVMFDVTSATPWLASSDVCSENKTYCEIRRTYNHKNSKTFKDFGETLLLPYNTYVSGDLVIDNIAIGTIKIKDQVFLEATYLDRDTEALDIDGVFGLGATTEVHPSKGKPPVVTPIVNMINQNLLREAVFAFHLAKPNNHQDKSELILGGVNNLHYSGNFKFTPMTVGNYYTIRTDKITLDDKEFGGPYGTLVDPNTRGITGGSALMKPLNENISATFNNVTQIYYVDCNNVKKLPTITIVINNIEYPMTGEDYVIENIDSNNKKTCMSGLFISDGNVVYLGSTFMQKYYIQFDLDKKRMGLATAK